MWNNLAQAEFCKAARQGRATLLLSEKRMQNGRKIPGKQAKVKQNQRIA